MASLDVVGIFLSLLFKKENSLTGLNGQIYAPACVTAFKRSSCDGFWEMSRTTGANNLCDPNGTNGPGISRGLYTSLLAET